MAGLTASFRTLSLVASFAVVLAGTGCGAVYPEVQTPLRAPPAGKGLEPAPPKDLVYVAFKEGFAPERTRDGRAWHELGNKLPDPFAVLFVNGKELIRTPRQSSTLNPTWPDAPKGNFRIQPSDRIRVEMWESGLVDKPMCVKDLGTPDDEWVAGRQVTAQCDWGARIVVSWEPAHGQFGYGFYYEFRTTDVYVTRVFEESPAARAGIKPGDLITTLGDRRAREMKPGEVQGYLNAPRGEPIKLGIKHKGSEPIEVEITEGAVYPLFSETTIVAN